MKNLTVLALFAASISFGQVKTTTQNGNFWNPLVWDCVCIPADGDSLVIAHDIQMTTSIYYTSGQIIVNNGASLVEDGTDRDIWINGGSFINNGTVEARDLWLASGWMNNSGSIGPLDSIWVQGPFTNTGNLTTYDILTDQTSDVDNSGSLTITNNFNNQGVFLNTGEISVSNDFSNCNIQSMDAIFTNNNIMCITNDFSNCAGDTLKGSGHYYIGGSSANLGVFDGTFTFHTPSGTVGVPGDIQPGVTVTTGSCDLGAEEREVNSFSIFPNPASSIIETSFEIFEYAIYDYAGRMVDFGTSEDYLIYIDHLENGVYWLRVLSNTGDLQAVKFIKE